MSTKTLLIIGAGLQQIRAYQRARELGLTVVGTDMNPAAPAFEFADYKLICSTRDADETLQCVLKFAKDHPIHGVMTIANDVPYTVAQVAHALGLPGLSPESASKVSHKRKMKECFVSAGVATPEYEVVRTWREFESAVKRRGYPLIIKPSDGRGSKGVFLLDGTEDLEWIWQSSSAVCNNGELLLERFESGEQISVESLFVNGEYRSIAFADRNYERVPDTKPYIIEDGGMIPSHIDASVEDAIATLVENAARSLGIGWGSVKADIVLTDRGPMIIELAARLSGGFLATHHIPMAYGVDLVGAVIRIALGEVIQDKDYRPIKKCYIGVRYMFGSEGKITAIRMPEFDDENIVVERYLQVGDVLPKLTFGGCNAGFILSVSSNYDDAHEKVKSAISKVKIEVE